MFGESDPVTVTVPAVTRDLLDVGVRHVLEAGDAELVPGVVDRGRADLQVERVRPESAVHGDLGVRRRREVEGVVPARPRQRRAATGGQRPPATFAVPLTVRLIVPAGAFVRTVEPAVIVSTPPDRRFTLPPVDCTVAAAGTASTTVFAVTLIVWSAVTPRTLRGPWAV